MHMLSWTKTPKHHQGQGQYVLSFYYILITSDQAASCPTRMNSRIENAHSETMSSPRFSWPIKLMFNFIPNCWNSSCSLFPVPVPLCDSLLFCLLPVKTCKTKDALLKGKHSIFSQHSALLLWYTWNDGNKKSFKLMTNVMLITYSFGFIKDWHDSRVQQVKEEFGGNFVSELIILFNLPGILLLVLSL